MAPAAQTAWGMGMSDGDYLPGEPRPRGPVPNEPPGLFSDAMHTRWATCVKEFAKGFGAGVGFCAALVVLCELWKLSRWTIG